MPKIRIKEMGGRFACNGFFPYANVKLMPGKTMEVDDDLAEKCVNTGLVEVVWEKSQEAPRRGRPPKEKAEDDQSLQ